MRWLDGITEHELEQTQGDSDGQRSLACCSSWDHKESDMPPQSSGDEGLHFMHCLESNPVSSLQTHNRG